MRNVQQKNCDGDSAARFEVENVLVSDDVRHKGTYILLCHPGVK